MRVKQTHKLLLQLMITSGFVIGASNAQVSMYYGI